MEKTIHFRQVEWFGQNQNLPNLLRTALEARPEVADTAFQSDGETFEVRHRDIHQNEVRLHLAAHVQGARKAITPRARRGALSADLRDAPPPANSEFTEREMAIVARRTTLGFVTTGTTRDSKVQKAVRGLIAMHHGANLANRLVLPARADAAMIARLLQDGVDTLDFGLVLPTADADEVVEGQPLSIAESVGRSVGAGIMARLAADADNEELDMFEEMNARLLLKLRKRRPTVDQVASLTAIAADAVEDDEDFRIRTRNKVVFTRDKLLLKSSFTHPANPTNLQYALAWDAIADFLDNN